MLVAQGDRAGALAAYRKGLDIVERWPTRDPANTEWQRDLSVSHDKIGDVLVAQGDRAGALAAYRESLNIREALAARDPANTEWQRDLSVSHDKIGDVLVAQGDGAGALAAYRKGLDIREALAARDPGQYRVAARPLGEPQQDRRRAGGPGRRGRGAGRLPQKPQHREALAARDPANTEWQRDLSVSHNKIGDVLVAQGDRAGALAAYRKSLHIREALAARDPANTEWQRDVAVSCWKLHALGHAAGSVEVRRTLLQRGLTILIRQRSLNQLPASDSGWIQLFEEAIRKLEFGTRLY